MYIKLESTYNAQFVFAPAPHGEMCCSSCIRWGIAARAKHGDSPLLTIGESDSNRQVLEILSWACQLLSHPHPLRYDFSVFFRVSSSISIAPGCHVQWSRETRGCARGLFMCEEHETMVVYTGPSPISHLTASVITLVYCVYTNSLYSCVDFTADFQTSTFSQLDPTSKGIWSLFSSYGRWS